MKMPRTILTGDSEKMIKYEELIPYVTEKLLDFNQPKKESLCRSRSN
jgi:hypothetical protein